MVFFTAINYGHLNKPVAVCDPHEEAHSFKSSSEEKIIEVASQLKKEELRFRPDEFLYAEAEGNYVTFYLKSKDTIKKVMIRNSISNIARQLSHYPFFFRSHRAYIINLNMVHSKHGNALGYRLKIEGVHFEIPVSRSNIKSFDHRYTLCQC